MLRDCFVPIMVLFAVIVMIGEAYTKKDQQNEELKKELAKLERASDHG